MELEEVFSRPTIALLAASIDAAGSPSPAIPELALAGSGAREEGEL
jgi:hypothetical protein